MKRFQSAFAVPSGFAVAAGAKLVGKNVRRSEAAARAGDSSSTAGPAKRPACEIRDRAA